MTSPSQKRHQITTSSPPMIHQRLAAVRASMATQQLRALLVTELSHVRYLTGFSGSNGICLFTSVENFFLTDNRYKSQAPQEIKNFTIIIAKESLFRTLAERKLIPRQMRIGFESQYISIAEMQNLKKLFPGRQFIPTTSIIEDLSAIKDTNEVELIRSAVHITDRVFKKILPLVRPGVRECDIAVEISYWHRRYGAEGDAFDPIVASGASNDISPSCKEYDIARIQKWV